MNRSLVRKVLAQGHNRDADACVRQSARLLAGVARKAPAGGREDGRWSALGVRRSEALISYSLLLEAVVASPPCSEL